MRQVGTGDISVGTVGEAVGAHVKKKEQGVLMNGCDLEYVNDG